MSRRPLRLRGRPLLALPCLVVALLAGLPARPAAAAPISQCTTTKGVVVVVDFRHFGGAVERGCGPTPTTGYDALHHAGFNTAGDDEDGPAFVCRIDDSPTPAQASCTRTPPTSAAWSYWHANPGQNSWSFSQLGAMSSHPQPGSVDAWVYGSTVGGGHHGQPSFSPASVRAKGPAPTPSPSQPTPRPSHPPTTHAPRHHGSAAVAPGATGTPSPSPSRPARQTHRHLKHFKTLPDTVPSPTSARPAVVDQAKSAQLVAGSSGSPTGLIIGAVLVVVLGGAGGLTAWRRRRPSQ